MPTGTLSPVARFQFFDDVGSPLDGGLLYTYTAGTSTPATTYNNVDLDALHANENPIKMDPAGRPSLDNVEVPIFLVPGSSYKYILRKSDGTILWTQDNIQGPPLTTSTYQTIGTLGQSVTADQGVYLSRGDGSLIAGRWYLWDSAKAYSSTIPQVGFVLASGSTGDVVSIQLGARVTGLTGLNAGSGYYAGTSGALIATAPVNPRYVGQADTTTSLIVGPPPVPTIDVGICEGRLTLTSGTPVTTSDVTAAGTIHFTPFRGNRIALYDGTQWILRTFAEISIAVPAALSQMYDVWVYDNAGTVTLEVLAWTSDTARATALTTQDGIYSKTGALTRRYLGSFRSTAVANQTEDSVTKRYLWNYYNRVRRQLLRLETTASWAYTTATVRQANAGAGTANQVDIVVGVAEVLIDLELHAGAQDGTVNKSIAVGIGENATNAFSASNVGGAGLLSADGTVSGMTLSARLVKYPAVGRSFYPWNEWSAATGTTLWYGAPGAASAAANTANGLNGSIEA
jgi:hypothetical protein